MKHLRSGPHLGWSYYLGIASIYVMRALEIVRVLLSLLTRIKWAF